MFPTDDFIAWLQAQPLMLPYPTTGGPATAVAYHRDGYITAPPDRLITVTPNGGADFVDEEATIVHTFVQLHVRGRQNDPQDASDLMDAVDKTLIKAVRPVFGTRLCHAIGYTGGGPAAFQRDTARRYAWVGNYRFMLAY